MRHANIRARMTEISPTSQYALGNTDAEHERLIWQAERVAPLTERLFREAGIGPGQRVLDLGSGVGDVAMLVSRLVGPSGEVVGIERDSRSIARARARVVDVVEAGLRNVGFIQSDVSEITESKPFDAAVGHFILMWLPDPASVLRSVSQLVRPGGVIAFQEPYCVPVLSLLAPLPLWYEAASLGCRPLARNRAGLASRQYPGPLLTNTDLSSYAINQLLGIVADPPPTVDTNHAGAPTVAKSTIFPKTES
jgi:SAM-dependent methyltransferase